MYYVLAAIQVYFVCEWLKRQDGWIQTDEDQRHDAICVAFMKEKTNIHEDKVYSICDALNHRDNFLQFVFNLMYVIMVLYCLTRSVIPDYSVHRTGYWVCALVSSVVISLLNNVSYFQFSVASDNHRYNVSKTVILSVVTVLMICLLLRQIYTGRVRYGLVAMPVLLYFSVWLLFLSVSFTVSWHLHHAIVAGYLSLFFTDLAVVSNWIMHSMFIGIVIQGINFYTMEEIFLFRIHHHPPPSRTYMYWLNAAFFVAVCGIYNRRCIYARTCARIGRRRVHVPELHMQLIPNTR